jgi:hypothetical protein
MNRANNNTGRQGESPIFYRTDVGARKKQPKEEISESIKKELESCAKKIDAAREQEFHSIFERGDELRRAHTLLANHKNGRFWRWVKERCRLGQTQGRRYMDAADAVPVQNRTTVAQYIDVTALYELTKPSSPPEALEGAIKAASEGKHVRRKDAEGMIQISREMERSNGMAELPKRVRLICCDMKEIVEKLSIEPGSVAVVLTHPLYGEADLWMYEAVAALAAKVLRPGGWLLAYAGKIFLDQIHVAMRQHLTYSWQFDVMHRRATVVDALQIEQGAKYVVGYRHQPETPWWPAFVDRLEFAAEKYLGKWQQPVGEAEYLLSSLCPPGGRVLDPCCGTGTVGVACLRLELSFTGGDIDPKMVEIARERLAAVGEVTCCGAVLASRFCPTCGKKAAAA